MLMRRGIGGSVDKHGDASFVRDLPNDFIWLIRIGGILAHLVNRHGHYPLADRIKELQVPDDATPLLTVAALIPRTLRSRTLPTKTWSDGI